MPTRFDTVNFGDYAEFCRATTERDRAEDFPEGLVFHLRTPFASVKSERYRLFGMVELQLYEIVPAADIHFKYELDLGFFEIGYVREGSFYLLTEGYGEDVIGSRHLYIAPPSGSQGKITYYRDLPLKTISFSALRSPNEVLGKILEESGYELWSETIESGGGGKCRKLYPLMSPSPDVVNSFFQVAHCHYPHRIKQMFFENILREILLKIIARGLPPDETPENLDEFEVERIKSVPEILMERRGAPPSIPELARELSLNATKLKRGFKEIFGKPIYAHRRDVCLERAAIMLLDTSKAVSEIAGDVGYLGSGNFSNAFKKRYGVSPAQFRRSGRPSPPC
ncbi:MAG: AraC family transcriptional regulator [Synergistaceae bacterium]|jgi:AraC-like DNA-binding protein|nr:AraC family transcriptional regulator [Synergistaceae bacterium]